MHSMVYLIPLSLALGFIWLLVFFWTLRRDQYEDLDGAAERILYDADTPLPPPGESAPDYLQDSVDPTSNTDTATVRSKQSA